MLRDSERMGKAVTYRTVAVGCRSVVIPGDPPGKTKPIFDCLAPNSLRGPQYGAIESLMGCFPYRVRDHLRGTVQGYRRDGLPAISRSLQIR